MRGKLVRLSFFIAGVQKGGTTALYKLLANHPQLFIPENKELHFFDRDYLDWQRPDYRSLHNLFGGIEEGPGVTKRLLGDATPIYCYWPNAIERIAAYNSEARIIILLRHPTFRAYSHWRMEAARGIETLSFADAISDEGRLRVAANGAHRRFSYIERGFYGDQVKRLYDVFPSDQVLILRTDQLWLSPAKVCAAAVEFLGVRPMTDVYRQYITPYEHAQTPEMTLSVKERLNALFAPQIQEAQKRTGIDLSDWLDPGYSEPMVNDGAAI